jgi:hypothetical protein
MSWARQIALLQKREMSIQNKSQNFMRYEHMKDIDVVGGILLKIMFCI